jgi:DNA polymerase III subunit chi
LRVDFHTGLAEPLLYAARLLAKARRQGERVCLASPRAEALSRLLWSEPERGFFAHARPGAAAATWRRSALWLLPAFDHAVAQAERPAVWVNLGADAPADVAGCKRLIELVAAGPDEARAGRQRWLAYKARGFTPTQLVNEAAGPAQ